MHTSPHEVSYRGRTFPTAYHLLQSLQFSDQAIIEDIRNSSDTQGLAAVVDQNRSAIEPGWELVVLDMVRCSIKSASLTDLLRQDGPCAVPEVHAAS